MRMGARRQSRGADPTRADPDCRWRGDEAGTLTRFVVPSRWIMRNELLHTAPFGSESKLFAQEVKPRKSREPSALSPALNGSGDFPVILGYGMEPGRMGWEPSRLDLGLTSWALPGRDLVGPGGLTRRVGRISRLTVKANGADGAAPSGGQTSPYRRADLRARRHPRYHRQREDAPRRVLPAIERLPKGAGCDRNSSPWLYLPHCGRGRRATLPPPWRPSSSWGPRPLRATAPGGLPRTLARSFPSTGRL